MSTKMALGKGFEGLIPVGLNIAQVAQPGETVKVLALEDIVTNPDQPRREFDEEKLRELAKSIEEHGVIQPIIVTPKNNKYRLVAGERRYRASLLAKLKNIPAIVRDHKELEEVEIALVENVQRVDLSALEQAVSIVRLRDQFSLTPRQIAKKLGKAETTISNMIRLLHLPKEAIIALNKNQITEGHARAILALKFNETLQSELLERILKEHLSVREAEEIVKILKVKNEQKSSSLSNVNTKRLEKLKSKGIAVKLQHRKKGGQILLSFKDEAEFVSILFELGL